MTRFGAIAGIVAGIVGCAGLGGLMEGMVWGQAIFVPQPVVSGVAIDAEGVVKVKTEGGAELAKVRERVKAARAEPGGAADVGMVTISLPKLFAEARAAYEAGKELPGEVQYLGGLQGVKYVFVYPDEKDVVVAGPGGEWEALDGVGVVGKKSGRPVMQWDDLLVLMREGRSKGGTVGCSIDPAAGADAQKISDEVAKQNSGKSPAAIAAAMAKAMGQQNISVLGVPGGTRAATVMVGADVKLKRFSLGLEVPAVPGIGSAFDAKAGGSRLWFELNYEPVRVSADGLAYELQGPKLKVLAGQKMFSNTGATPAAEKFAKGMSEKIGDMIALTPSWGELANVADLGMVAELIHRDKLDEKAGWDLAWALDDKTVHLDKYPTPRTMDTLAAVNSGAVASGGVSFKFAAAAAKRDTADDLAAVREKHATPQK